MFRVLLEVTHLMLVVTGKTTCVAGMFLDSRSAHAGHAVYCTGAAQRTPKFVPSPGLTVLDTVWSGIAQLTPYLHCV
jgi:hypothetical protein